MSTCFAVYVLSLNLDNTNVIKFNLNNLQDDTFQILYQDKEIRSDKYKICWFGTWHA